MGTAYTRQSSFSDGDTITAALFNNEYNQLLTAFSYASSSTTGHQHDGSAGEGGNVHTIGDQDFLNKIVADSTNNRWGVFVQVSSSAVEQIRISDGVISPVTDNDIDLGTSSLEFKDAYFDGTVTTDALTVSSTTNLDGAIQVDNTITVGVDDTGYDVKFFGDTASAYMLWDTSTDDLVLAGAAGIDLAGDIDVDGTANLDVVDIDGAVDMASTLTLAGNADFNGDLDVDGTTNLDAVDIDGAVQIDAAVTVGVDDTGYDVKFFGATASAYMLWDASTDDLVLAGAAGIDLAGDIDVDGTANLDAVDIDGAVQIDGTVTVGVDDTGLDVKFFGATSGSYLLWDESADSLLLTDSTPVKIGDSQDMTLYHDGTNSYLTNAVGALKVATETSGIAITIGHTTSETTVADNLTVTGNASIGGNLDVTGSFDMSDADITNIGSIALDTITNDGTDITLDSSGDIVLDAGGADVRLKDDGTQFGRFTNNSSDFVIASSVDDKDIKFNGEDDGSTITALTLDMSAAGAATFNDKIIATELDISGNMDIDGTSNLDAVDIDGAVQIDAAVTVGVDDTGYDVKFFGNTASAYMLWDTSADDLVLAGAAGIDLAGDIDVDGTANLDVVDIDGAVDMASTLTLAGNADFNGDLDVDGTTNLDAVDVDGAVNFAADVTYADGADIITASAGTSNFRAGVNAGNSITSGGNYNVCVGDEAGTAITTGDNNVAIGYLALDAEDTGIGSTAVGYGALSTQNNDASNYNTAVGHNAATALTEAIQSTLIGAGAGEAVTTGSAATYIGYRAGNSATTVGANTFVGYKAGEDSTDATYCTGVGYEALLQLTTGTGNSAFGREALELCTTGDRNTAVGYQALQGSVIGDRSVAVGYGALKVQNPSSNADMYNVAIGYNAGVAVTTGISNIIIGGIAGDAITTGSGNVGIGRSGLGACTEGANNTTLGAYAGVAITTGDNNICIGADAGRSGSPGGNITTGDNLLCLGDENITASHVQVDWTVASDQRDKTDFTQLDLGLDFVNDLNPVTYKWDKRSKYVSDNENVDLDTVEHDGTHKEDWLDIGFKAQEVEALEEASGYSISNKTNLTTSLSEDGKQYGLQYSKFVPILVNAVQELSAQVDELKSEIKSLKEN